MTESNNKIPALVLQSSITFLLFFQGGPQGLVERHGPEERWEGVLLECLANPEITDVLSDSRNPIHTKHSKLSAFAGIPRSKFNKHSGL